MAKKWPDSGIMSSMAWAGMFFWKPALRRETQGTCLIWGDLRTVSLRLVIQSIRGHWNHFLIRQTQWHQTLASSTLCSSSWHARSESCGVRKISTQISVQGLGGQKQCPWKSRSWESEIKSTMETLGTWGFEECRVFVEGLSALVVFGLALVCCISLLLYCFLGWVCLPCAIVCVKYLTLF